MTARVAGRVRVVGSRLRRWGEEGMTTAEYAVGTMAAVAFAALLLATYGLYAAGMVPPMVYLADLAARGRGLGVGIGALLWLVFGLAGVAGGVLSGRVVDRLGGLATLRLWLLIQAAALALCLPGRPDLGGVIGLGGSGGTVMVTKAMRALPVGVPKLMVSTLASGDVRPFVDVSDITMMSPVTDIAIQLDQG